MTTAEKTAAVTPLSKLNKAGLVLAFLIGLADLTSPFQPTPGGQDGPPYAILLLDAALGLITVVAVVVAWRTAKRGAVRLVAGARIISMITALPAFFVDVPAGIKVLVGVMVLLTVAVVTMVLTPARRPVPITD
ncbi:MAG: hypothetical protein QOI74_2147 [Micromonosporaceae bacterium]|jgi:hypothetical protein|nr:hypothetical protein [Micromonosporaceae bacterium]MDT5036122.1 hypothetical protein [Micromonosporaceae bacterium]